jgi:hypothetical protein
MHRATAAALATGLLLTSFATTQAASAAPVTRGVYVEEYDGTESFEAGGNQCVGYAGTEHEVRSGQYALMAPGTGPRNAEVKVRGAIDGFVEIAPTDPRDGPSYSGAYSERVIGWLMDPDNDAFRVGHLRLRGRLSGSDGSTVVVLLTYKVTLRTDGTVAVQRESFTCR